jgi:hypothetical protein
VVAAPHLILLHKVDEVAGQLAGFAALEQKFHDT